MADDLPTVTAETQDSGRSLGVGVDLVAIDGLSRGRRPRRGFKPIVPPPAMVRDRKKELGWEMSRRRRQYGWSLATVADACDITRATLCDIEKGRILPSIETFANWCVATRMEPKHVCHCMSILSTHFAPLTE